MTKLFAPGPRGAAGETQTTADPVAETLAWTTRSATASPALVPAPKRHVWLAGEATCGSETRTSVPPRVGPELGLRLITYTSECTVKLSVVAANCWPFSET